MGTSFRSALSWDIPVTVVELSPSVVDMFGFFYSDSSRILRQANAKIVIDDGRRFLNRTDELFDAIIIDPPPPIEAAASGLLYSNEFYRLVKKHLSPNGILQQWFPGGDQSIEDAVRLSLLSSFPHVIEFLGLDQVGYHFLASQSEIPELSPDEFFSRMPESARRDLFEWNDDIELKTEIPLILKYRKAIALPDLNRDRSELILDDRPMNEYFILRRSGYFNFLKVGR